MRFFNKMREMLLTKVTVIMLYQGVECREERLLNVPPPFVTRENVNHVSNMTNARAR